MQKKIMATFLGFIILLSIVTLTGCRRVEDPQTDPVTTQAPATEEETTAPGPVDYDNGVVRKPYTVEKVLLDNDFSQELDPTVTKNYHKSSWYGATATLEDGWLHLTSSEHLFVFGTHYFGAYGGLQFETGKTYTVSFDLKRGSEFSNNAFTLTLAEEVEDQDPRFGNQLKQVVIDFDNYEEMVAFNSDKGTFAAVSYKADTGICHIEIQFTVDRGGNNYLINSRSTSGLNDWYLDNLYIAQITTEDSDFQWIVEDTTLTYDYASHVSVGSYSVREVLLSEAFRYSADLKNGGRSAFFGPSQISLDSGMARITTNQHLFTFGRFKDWENFGGVEFQKDHSYVMSFDLKLGDARTQKVFNLYVMQETDPDPRFGSVQNALTLDFSDLYRQQETGEDDYFVKTNTNNFASVSYNSETRVAHIVIRFRRNGDTGIVVVSKGTGDNEWLLDNFYIADVTPDVQVTAYDYDNGVRFDSYEVKSVLFTNDFSSELDKGVTQSWHKSAFFGSNATIEAEAAHLISEEHLFTWGTHSWGIYGGVSFTKGTTYKISFDLQLGDNNANREFNVYVMTENNDDPRFGDIQKTLSLNYMDFTNLVKENTDNFASVVYSRESDWTHIELLFTTSSAKNTMLVSRSRGDNDWLLDNLQIEEVRRTCPGHIDANGDGKCDLCDRVIYTDRDYSNGITFENYQSIGTVFENDFTENADKGVTQAWHKSAFFGSSVSIDDGWAHITSDEHIFVFGSHAWGLYGGISFDKDSFYQASFDLKIGDEDTLRSFNLYVTTEGEDPRSGDVLKTLRIDFADFEHFVTENTDNFASVFYDAQDHVAHIKILFRTSADKSTLLVSKNAGANDWYLSNLVIEKMQFVCPGHVDENGDLLCDICNMPIQTEAESDYTNGVKLPEHTVVSTLFENDFSENVDKGVTAAWHKSAFFGSTASLDNGWARITSSEHMFVYGGHTWGNYGGVSFEAGKTYLVSLNIKLGADNANTVWNLYVTEENGDPRYGDVVKTLTLNFANIAELVTENTDNFASVSYSVETKIVHIAFLMTTAEKTKTLLVSRSAGNNNILLDDLKMEEVVLTSPEQDYDNGVKLPEHTVESTLFENDFSENVDKGVTAAWHKSAFYGSTASLDNGWARITSSEHMFVYGGHTWGNYGGVSFEAGKTYLVSLNIKLGADNANTVWNLYVTEENGDPRYGDVVKTLTLNFANIAELVTENTDNFASVSYSAETKIVHIAFLMTTAEETKTLLVSKSAGNNNILLDDLKMEKVVLTSPEQDYDNGVKLPEHTVESTLFENDFSEDVDKGVTAAWHKSAFYGSTATLDDGWLHLTSTEHLFVYGMHSWGQYGGVKFTPGSSYKVSLDLKLGNADGNKLWNLYVMTENGDPRFGTVVKTLSLNWENMEALVTQNTDDFASVTYSAETKSVHIDLIFTADSAANTQLVSKSAGSNDLLFDNLKIEEVTLTSSEQDYDNGVTLPEHTVVSTLFENDFSEDADKGVTAAWHKSAFYGSTATLDDGWLDLTSTEHLFVYGMHSWGQYGGVNFEKGKTYKVSFDLKLGAENANPLFNLYVTTENGDPRFGDVCKTLTLDFSNISNFTVENTDGFSSVSYEAVTMTAHITLLLTADETANTLLVAKSNGNNHFLLDNFAIEEVEMS